MEPWMKEALEKLRREQGRPERRIEIPAPPPPEPRRNEEETKHETWTINL